MDENNKKPPTEEEIEELMKAIKQIEEEQKKKNKKRPRGFFVIEFGGVYHTNPIINFLFSLLINITLAVLIIEIFNLATYQNELVFIGFIGVYTVFEAFVKYFVTIYLLQYVIKSFGFLFYILYLIIFFVVDQYLFTNNLFSFDHEYFIVTFVTLFVIIRYVVGTQIRRRLRQLR